jgi:23S rRNA (adenine2503-C2)-methyltransferase
LSDKEKIETVLMKFNYGYSLCISSQVGCNMGCKFCASGLLKKIRNLTVNEIILQYVIVTKYLWNQEQQRINNVVIMGIGEPFDNYDCVADAIKILNQPQGIGLGARHITVSTCGIANKIMQFAQDFPQVNLAISLHAPNDSLRSKLMPVNKAYPLEELITILKRYIKQTNRRVTFEYILLDQVNDQDIHAQALAKLVKGLLCYINLIIYNKIPECDFLPSKRLDMFSQKLTQLKIMNTKRLERGKNILAACGQLRAQHGKK